MDLCTQLTKNYFIEKKKFTKGLLEKVKNEKKSVCSKKKPSPTLSLAVFYYDDATKHFHTIKLVIIILFYFEFGFGVVGGTTTVSLFRPIQRNACRARFLRYNRSCGCGMDFASWHSVDSIFGQLGGVKRFRSIFAREKVWSS